MRAKLRVILKLEALLICSLVVIFLIPQDASHLNLQREPQSLQGEKIEQNLIEDEEALYIEIMKHHKSGHVAKATEAAKKYMINYPVGKYYYEVYKIFKSRSKK